MREITALRAAGIASIVAAALGSVLVATPAVSEGPSTSTTCSAEASSNWVFRNCDQGPGTGSPGADARGVSAP